MSDSSGGGGHVRIMLGLVLGAVVGSLVNAPDREKHVAAIVGADAKAKTDLTEVLKHFDDGKTTPADVDAAIERFGADRAKTASLRKLFVANAPDREKLIATVVGDDAVAEAELAAVLKRFDDGKTTPSDVDAAIKRFGADADKTGRLDKLFGRAFDLRPWVEQVVKYVAKPVGDIFLNLLFMGIVPLVFASLTLGVTRLGGGGDLGRVGFKTITYFILTTACAAAIGLTAVNILRPGDRLPAERKDELMRYYSKEAGEKLEKKSDFGVATFVNIVPRNPLKAFAEKDMLAVIFSALLVGVALTQLPPERSKPLIDLLETVNAITDFIIRLAMSMAPVGVFALIFSTTALFGWELLVALSAYVGTVLLGLALQWAIVFPILVATLGRMNPLEFFRRTQDTMVTAFSTSSSAATLPTAIKCAEEELGVPPPVARFVLPLSASMNHNGTALFEGVTVVFLAQAFGVNLTFAQEIVVLILCVLTATGMAGVPGGSLPLIGMVLAVVDVPPGAIAIVMGVDRLLDMCRTMVNVTGDMTTALYVGRSEGARMGTVAPD